MAVTATAVALARLRATWTAPLSELPSARALTAAAERAGLQIRFVGRGEDRRAVLAVDDTLLPDPESAVPVRRLSPVQLLTLAAALRCCWPDPSTPLWPASPAARSDVLAATASIGADERYVTAALDFELPAAHLLVVDDTSVAVGDAVAAWSADQVDLLRRVHHRLPAPPAEVEL